MSTATNRERQTGPWETVIGLEVHVQLATQSKIFSATSTQYGAPPNTQASIIDLGLPGVLPVLNLAAVEMAVTFGLAIGAQINRHSVFDRKNYFYPDLPKGYQISQFSQPIVGKGQIDIPTADGGSRTINITRAHLEEDAGKSLHEAVTHRTGIDLNRAGTPLLEIVSEPELTCAAEAVAYFRQLHGLVRALRICDGNLNEGSMRCDVNVSVRPRGSSELGQRTEIKNVNSFKFVERAIDIETARQIDVLEAGGEIQQQTLLFDPERDETRPMRTKEMSDDYRYFPDPDLLPLVIDDAFIERVRRALPELPHARRARFTLEHKLSEYDADLLTRDPEVADYFEAALADCGDPKMCANWMNGDLAAALNKADLSISESPIVATKLAELISRIADGTLSTKTAKTAFDGLWTAPEMTLAAIIERDGLTQMNDSAELENLVQEVIAANPEQVAQFQAGKEKLLGFFVGKVMQATQGKANPKQLNELLRTALARD